MTTCCVLCSIRRICAIVTDEMCKLRTFFFHSCKVTLFLHVKLYTRATLYITSENISIRKILITKLIEINGIYFYGLRVKNLIVEFLFT